MKNIFTCSIIIAAILFSQNNGLNSKNIIKNNLGWIKAINGLNIRKSNNINAPKIELIPYGSQVEINYEDNEFVTIDGIKSKWVNIEWKNKSGWIFGGYLSSSNDFIKNIRRITAKKGLPIYNNFELLDEKIIIPYNTNVEIIDEDLNLDISKVKWNNKIYKVHNAFVQKLDIIENPIVYEIKRYIESSNIPLKHYLYHSDDISVKNIGDYYLISILVFWPPIPVGEESLGIYNFLLRKSSNSWAWVQMEYYGRSSDRIKLFYLNNDEIPDVISVGGCCGNSYLKVYIGQNNGNLNNIINLYASAQDKTCKNKCYVDILSLGKCKKTLIMRNGINYYYDCDKNEFIKY